MVIAPARRAGDPGSIPGPGENFSLKIINNQLKYLRKIRQSYIVCFCKRVFFKNVIIVLSFSQIM